MPNGGPQISLTGNHLGVNLGFTKFLFVVPRREDDAAGTRLRAVGALIARGFFNDFAGDGARETQPQETIQFLIREGDHLEETNMSAARYAVQVCSKYRPRLQEIEAELRRRLTDAAEVLAIDGAERTASVHERRPVRVRLPAGCGAKVRPHRAQRVRASTQ